MRGIGYMEWGWGEGWGVRGYRVRSTWGVG